MLFPTLSARRYGILGQMHFPKLLNQNCAYTARDSQVVNTC